MVFARWDLLMDAVLRSASRVLLERSGIALQAAAEKHTEVLVQVSEEFTAAVSNRASFQHSSQTHYWLELVPLAGLFNINGTAPPSSRKLTATACPPRLLDAKPPLKYGRRLTLVPL